MRYSKLVVAMYQYAYNVYDLQPRKLDGFPVHYRIADAYLWTNHMGGAMYLYRN
jgi:hypothetical protein